MPLPSTFHIKITLLITSIGLFLIEPISADVIVRNPDPITDSEYQKTGYHMVVEWIYILVGVVALIGALNKYFEWRKDSTTTPLSHTWVLIIVALLLFGYVYYLNYELTAPIPIEIQPPIKMGDYMPLLSGIVRIVGVIVAIGALIALVAWRKNPKKIPFDYVWVLSWAALFMYFFPDSTWV